MPTKKDMCPECNGQKYITSKICKNCQKAANEIATQSLVRKCSKCKNTFLKEELNRGKCRICNALELRERRAKETKEEKKIRNLKNKRWRIDNVDHCKYRNRINNCKKYGFSEEETKDIIQLLEIQKTCTICKRHVDECGPLCIDHDHDDNSFRGLICNHCNSGLGMFKDNIDNLQSSIEYLLCARIKKLG